MVAQATESAGLEWAKMLLLSRPRYLNIEGNFLCKVSQHPRGHAPWHESKSAFSLFSLRRNLCISVSCMRAVYGGGEAGMQIEI